jgi:OmpA-OmpF porin, OOP family
MDRPAQLEGFHSMTAFFAPRAPFARHILCGLSLAAFLAASPVLAQELPNPLKQSPNQTETNKTEPDPDDKANVQATLKRETDIIRSLAPFADGNPNSPPPAVREVDSDDGKVRVDYSRAVDITVFFEYDSAKLTPEARIQLEPLAKALMSDELKAYRFLLAGHTDAAGDAGYNERLSLKRADAVRRFLSDTFNINPSRLVVHGWGESRLKDPDQPRKSINRRVEVALILPEKDQSFYESDVLEDEGFIADLSPAQPLRAADLPFLAHGRLLPGRTAGITGCGRYRLTDPRLRLGAYDLDDFGAAPTQPCARRSMNLRHAPVRGSAFFDAVRGVWHETNEDEFAE